MGEREIAQADAWDAVADVWAERVRGGADRGYERNAAAFLQLLPPPGRATLDIGCGEGRLGAELVRRGHRVVGVDASPRMVGYARESHEAIVADAAALPFDDGSFDLVVAFMSLQDMDDPAAAVREAARVLETGGRLCLATLHPVFSAGAFTAEGDDAPFAISRSYLDAYRFTFAIFGNLPMPHLHQPLESWLGPVTGAGLLIEALREVPSRRQARVPVDVHVRAVKP